MEGDFHADGCPGIRRNLDVDLPSVGVNGDPPP